MKKRRKIFQRAAALLCCIFLLPSLVAVPALAADDMNIFFDVIDAGFLDPVYSIKPTSNEIVIDFGENRVVKYIDFVFTRAAVAPTKIFLRSSWDGSETRLNVISLGNMMYRAYGEVAIHSASKFSLVFETTGTSYIYPYTCKVSFNVSGGFPDIGFLKVSDYLGELTDWGMDSPTSPLTCWFRYPSTLGNNYICEYAAMAYFSNWRKYDYLDVHLTLSDASLSSLNVSIDGKYVPFEVSVVGDVDLFDWEVNETGGNIRYYPSGLDNYLYVNLRIDLTGLFRNGSTDLGVMISGQYSTDMANICLYSVTGFISDEHTELDTFWIKLKNFFSDLFGKNDPVAEQAQQTQDLVDQEVNIQITQAMADWEANIEYAETGFTSGLTLVTPSVAWISLLATRIFESMGDFGAVYIMIGFMSVTMLLLSKSGVAAKIANNIRHSSGGKK